MATTTDILGLPIPSSDGSDPAALAAIIGDLGNDIDAKVGNPSLTTTQINALTGDAKAAGRRVWDSTLGVEKVSNGTTWETQATEAYVDSSLAATVVGGVLAGVTDAAANIALVLPDLPAGATGWSVSCQPTWTLENTAAVMVVQINSVVGSLGSLRVWQNGALFIGAGITIHWQAVAY